ncbi:MAG: M81 family metallopeptidase, partial [Acetobacteraceae bacterium]|nr:M81 family metallopeptidase [Acetobacteraceae bacterium]
AHETNTFSKVPTTIESFRRGTWITGNGIAGARRATRTALGGSFEMADKHGWVLAHPICASANPSGHVDDSLFDQVCDMLLEAADGIDGALLHLHGAMVTQSHEDAEGELLRRLRAKVGPDIPIVVTLDLHGNITRLMADSANALIAVRTYPHIDHYEMALKGGELLQRAMLGEIKPVTVIAKRPMLRGLDGGRTQTGPMRELIDRGEAIEAAGGALVVSVCSGFTAADIFDIGPSVTVTTDANPAAGQKIAESFMDYAWEQRAYVGITDWSIADAVAHAKAGEGKHDRPLVMSDVTDNPGSGHYGDTTNVLRAMIAAELQNAAFYAIYDPDAARQCAAIGAGNTGTVTLGGKHDPAAGGGPLTLNGEVTTLSSGKFQAFGPMGGGVWREKGLSALFRVGGIDIAIISNNGQATDLAQLTSLGIDPATKSAIAVKSKHHFRAAFTPVAREIITIDGGGLGSAILANPEGYKRVRRPIWPLDPI